MKILIAGASGFIGKRLIKHWAAHELVVLGRDKNKLNSIFPGLPAYEWAELANLNPTGFDAVVNLAGETINHLRWTTKIKQQILDSRIKATTALTQWCIKDKTQHVRLLSVSGLSIYGLDVRVRPKPYTEQSKITVHPDFMYQVAHDWEAAASLAEQGGIRTSIMRFAVVLDKNEGALPRMLKPFEFYVGGKIGSGLQPFAWISIDDLVRAIDFILIKRINGPINLVAPQQLTQAQFAKALARALKRPSFLSMPAFVCRLIFGEMGEQLLLNGQSVYPKVLIDHGFEFSSADIDSALQSLGVTNE